MNFKIVFCNTGDELPFSAIYPELVHNYIHKLNEHNINNFALYSTHNKTIKAKAENLYNTILEINEFIHLFTRERIGVTRIEELFDQQRLNRYHADWANSHEIVFNIDEMRNHTDLDIRAEFNKIHNLYPDDIRNVTLANILARTNRLELYESLNSGIHYLESSFKKIMHSAIIPPDQHYIKIDNPFGAEVLSNDVCNLKLSYYVKGRTLYDKFVNFDMNLEYDDLNNHDIQSTRLELSLSQPQSIPLSTEYTSWCKTHNRTPTGDFVNLGNLSKLSDNLTKYRQIVYNNLIQGNNYSLVLDN